MSFEDTTSGELLWRLADLIYDDPTSLSSPTSGKTKLDKWNPTNSEPTATASKEIQECRQMILNFSKSLLSPPSSSSVVPSSSSQFSSSTTATSLLQIQQKFQFYSKLLQEIRHNSHLQHEHLHSFIKQIIREIQLNLSITHETLSSSIQQTFHQYEMNTLHGILTYFSIIKNELNVANSCIISEKSSVEIQKKQMLVRRDILLYATHLKNETNQQVQLNLLKHHTSQYTRCINAIYDNLGTFSILGRKKMVLSTKDVRVLDVFKISNQWLSSKLSAAAAAASANVENSNAGRLKGLFCALPAENVFGFSAYGIAEQALPAGCEELNKKDPSLFSSSWLFAAAGCGPQPTERPPAIQLPPHLAHLKKLAGTAARRSQRTIDRPTLRFSRFSTISTIPNMSSAQREFGVILALCRVLVSRPFTVTGFITDKEISYAAAHGYDAVHSSLTEEYALLDPSHVLPEFLIHVYFPTLDTTLPAQPTPTSSVSLPPMISLPPKVSTAALATATAAAASASVSSKVAAANDLSSPSSPDGKLSPTRKKSLVASSTLASQAAAAAQVAVLNSQLTSGKATCALTLLASNQRCHFELPPHPDTEENVPEIPTLSGDASSMQNILAKQMALRQIEESVAKYRQEQQRLISETADKLKSCYLSRKASIQDNSQTINNGTIDHDSLLTRAMSGLSININSGQLGSPIGI